MAHSKLKFLCNRLSDRPQTKLYFLVCPLSRGLSEKIINLELEGTLEGLLLARQKVR